MLKNHDLGVILAPTSHLINLIFCTNFKILPRKCFLVTTLHRCQDSQIKSKICVLNLFEIIRVEIPMSRFCYILAAIDELHNYFAYQNIYELMFVVKYGAQTIVKKYTLLYTYKIVNLWFPF